MAKQQVLGHKANGAPIYGYNAAGKPVCASQLPGRPTGTLCQNDKTMPNGRCKRHSGGSLSGVFHHLTKTGLYSKAAPEALAARIALQAQVLDKNSLDAEKHLLSARIEELFESLKNGCDKSTYQLLNERLHECLAVAMQEEVSASMIGALERAIHMASQGAREFSTWREVRSNIESLRKIQADEVKAREKANQYLTIEEANLLIMMLKSSVAKTLQEHKANYMVPTFQKYMRQIMEARGTGKIFSLLEGSNQKQLESVHYEESGS